MKTGAIAGIVTGIIAAVGTVVVLVVKKVKKPEVALDENGNVVTPPAPGSVGDVYNQGQTGSQDTGNDKADEIKLKSILKIYKQTGKFENPADAKYFIENSDSLGEDERPSLNDIKLALRRSNMVYFDNEISNRMSAADVDKFIKDYATVYDGKQVMQYAGGFDAPQLTPPYTDYQLRKLLANGWWFALWYDGGGTYAGHNQGYAATSAGGQFLVTFFDLWDANDSHKRKVFVPEKYKGDQYSYSFSGSGKVKNNKLGTNYMSKIL